MIFCGDIALPFSKAIELRNFPDELKQKDWFGNLEGSLVKEAESGIDALLKRRIVFNNETATRELIGELNFKGFGIANNHIWDAAEINVTLKNLQDLQIPYVGAGKNAPDACREITITSESVDYVIAAFGWKLIKCIYATMQTGGVNPYEKLHVLNELKHVIDAHPGKRVIAFMHWNYELELYPQPYDRDLAHELIDMGVYAVIGCHAHRVQPIEVYNGHPIVYGLGNFLFRQNTYMDGDLKFPPFSYREIAFEITKDDKWFVHEFEYNPEENALSYKGATECALSDKVFRNLPLDYAEWFKKNRYQKKALPAFCYKDSYMVYVMKCAFVNWRVKAVDMLVKNKGLFIMIKKLLGKIYG